MSTKALKRLQNKDSLMANDSGALRGSDDDDIDSKPAINPFLLLNNDNDNGDENRTEVELMGDSTVVQKKKTKKKTKKKQKKKGKALNATENENIDKLCAAIESNINIDSFKTVNENATPTSSSFQTENDLFRIDTKRLNPDTEMSERLGRLFEDGRKRNMKSKQKQFVGRVSKLVVRKNNWPPFTAVGLSMKLIDTTDGISTFQYEHTTVYQKGQFLFWDAVDSMDPDHFIVVLREYPYNVDTLLQLGEVLRANEDYESSRDLVERALYALECAFHPLFNVTLNQSRLVYTQAENRCFYLALYRHMNNCVSRGCYRTGLEFCKLIYSFSPQEDPLAMLLLIDYFALRANEFDYLVALFQTLSISKNVDKLPNFCYSIALAYFLKAQKLESSSLDCAQELSQADYLLRVALAKFPTMLPVILDACSIEPDKETSKAGSLFGLNENISGLNQLYMLYVHRSKSLWNTPEVISWLETNARYLIDHTSEFSDVIDEFREFRRTRFLGTPKNIVRHVFISEIKEALATLSQEWQDIAILTYDPLPPTDSKRDYEKPKARVQRRHDSYFRSFLQSMVPTFNPDTDLAVLDEEQGAAVGGGTGVDMQASMRRLMGALQDLVGQIEPPGIPRENQPENDDDEDEWA